MLSPGGGSQGACRITLNQKSLSRRAIAAGAMPLRRHLAAWLAILGLYVQLAAAGLCTVGLPSSADATGLGPFPICHSQSDDESAGQAQNDHAPGHQHECPFCAVHCHAAMVMAPSVAGLDSISLVAKPADPAPFIVPQAARFPAGAPPRGPPVSV